MKTIEKQIEHCWKPMEKYDILSEEFEDWLEGNIEDRMRIIKKMKPNQYISYMDMLSKGVKLFNSIIRGLREDGLDIGKGNCEYGYKMPLPNKNEVRQLIIFRRY